MAKNEKELLAALKTHFGHDGFRGVQKDAIETVMTGRDCLVVMPTGGGKSLCYGLPALLLPGLALVVSPLIALMQDQVAALTARGIRAAHLSSSLSAAERRQVLAGIRPRRLQLDLLFVTPESLSTEGFMLQVQELHTAGQLAFVAVDEAHCISSWGHDFRPAYRTLRSFRAQCPGVPIMALTATATEEVRRDICATLRLQQPRTLLSSFNRPNISYAVHYPDVGDAGEGPGEGGREGDDDGGAYRLLLRLLGERCGQGGSAIVYAHKRQDAAAAAGFLKQAGWAAAAYHAGLPSAERDAVLQDWQRGRLRVVAATVAFGMGIDKADVRLVVHLSMPKSLEGFYQESGRAGRDGAPAHSVLLYRYSDRRLHEYLVGKEARRKQAKAPDQGAQIAQRALAALNGVVAYCMGERCRRATVLEHFGEWLPQGACTGCDVCSDPEGIRQQVQDQRAHEAQARVARWGGSGRAGGGDGGERYGAGEYSGSSDGEGWERSGGSGSGSEDEAPEWEHARVPCSGQDVKQAMATLAAAEAAEYLGRKRTAAEAIAAASAGESMAATAAGKRPKPAAASAVDDTTRELARKQLQQKLAGNQHWCLQAVMASKLAEALEAAMHTKCPASKAEYQKLYRELVAACKSQHALLGMLQPFLRWPPAQQPQRPPAAGPAAALVQQWQGLVSAVLDAQISLLERGSSAAGAGDGVAAASTGNGNSSRGGSGRGADAPGVVDMERVQLLRLLEQLPVNKALLSGTGAGVRMNRLAKKQEGIVGDAANDVVKAWKKCVGK